jgi:hypothetical protein
VGSSGESWCNCGFECSQSRKARAELLHSDSERSLRPLVRGHGQQCANDRRAPEARAISESLDVKPVVVEAPQLFIDQAALTGL